MREYWAHQHKDGWILNAPFAGARIFHHKMDAVFYGAPDNFKIVRVTLLTPEDSAALSGLVEAAQAVVQEKCGVPNCPCARLRAALARLKGDHP